jgi:hypothetical protein
VTFGNWFVLVSGLIFFGVIIFLASRGELRDDFWD